MGKARYDGLAARTKTVTCRCNLCSKALRQRKVSTLAVLHILTNHKQLAGNRGVDFHSKLTLFPKSVVCESPQSSSFGFQHFSFPSQASESSRPVAVCDPCRHTGHRAGSGGFGFSAGARISDFALHVMWERCRDALL